MNIARHSPLLSPVTCHFPLSSALTWVTPPFWSRMLTTAPATGSPASVLISPAKPAVPCWAEATPATITTNADTAHANRMLFISKLLFGHSCPVLLENRRDRGG